MLDLSKLADPVFELQTSNGEVRSYDPFLAMEVVQNAMVKYAVTPATEETKGSQSALYDGIRTAFGLPSLTGNQCSQVWVELNEFMASLDITKKMIALGKPDKAE